MREVGLYIHIPFCKQKCFYCDFPSYGSMEHLMDDYVEALCKEINNKAKQYKIRSIFVGGGTPSFLDKENIKKLLDTINTLNFKKGIEITMECNPGVLEKEKLRVMFENGVNRISMGLQAVQNPLLKTLGRVHSYEEFEKNFKNAREVGFKNINVDLMFGIPNQTVENWKESLHTIARLEPEHISAYSLIVEEGTKYYSLYQKDKLILPSEEEEREMYESTKEILKAYNYNQYEISNYAKNSKECLHNKIYWKLEDYLGVGSASSSYLEGRRIKNINNVKEYIDKINLGESVEEINSENSQEDNMEEFMFMGLRLMEGIKLSVFEEKFTRNIYSVYGEIIDKSIKRGLLEVVGDNLRLTSKGVELSNMVMSDFILEK